MTPHEPHPVHPPAVPIICRCGPTERMPALDAREGMIYCLRCQGYLLWPASAQEIARGGERP